MPNIILFGPQASGKGTQARLLAQRYHLVHVATGDIFRNEIEKKTEFGTYIEEILNKGNLVPDEKTIEIMNEKINGLLTRGKGMVLDGYPRDIIQARAIEKVPIDFVFFIDISDEEAVIRIRGRLVCACGASYNLATTPPKHDMRCDLCGQKLRRRDDESEEAVRQRLALYHKRTEPLKNYYTKKKILHRIDGEQPVEKVFSDICAIIDKNI